MSIDAEEIAGNIAQTRRNQRLLVAVDGVDASGKTTFAACLADSVRALRRDAHVIHVDDFMHVSAVRHRRGRNSPVGYFHDSYDYDALTRYVLDPLSRTGDGWFRAGVVDHVRDVARLRAAQYAVHASVTIVEGLFLLRDELVQRWDLSVFLDVGTQVSLARKTQRDGLILEPDDARTRRYVEGQRMYLERCRPMERATWVVENA